MHVVAFAEHGHRVFAAKDALLGNHKRIMFGGCQPGGAQFAGMPHHRNTDRRPFAGRLDKERQPKLFLDGVEITLRIEHDELGNGQTDRTPQQLGTPLVHTHGGGHHAAPGIRNVHQLKRTLNRPVLAVTTV